MAGAGKIAHAGHASRVIRCRVIRCSDAARHSQICHYRVIISVVTCSMVNDHLLRHGEVLVQGDAAGARRTAFPPAGAGRTTIGYRKDTKAFPAAGGALCFRLPPQPRPNPIMPNPWTGQGNPYTRQEVRDRLQAALDRGEPIIAAGAGTGISAKFIEKGGADLIIIYNSGRFRMSGHGSTCGLMAYDDANQVAMDIGEYEVLPIVEEVPVICGVHATDPRRRMWHWLGKVKDMGFSGVNNFPTHTIIDGHFRGVLEETGMSVKKEFEMIALAHRMDLFTIVYVATAEEAKAMAEVGADAIIAHVGTTVGGSIGVTNAVVSMDDAVRRTQAIIEGARSTGRKDIFFLSHGGPIATPEDAAYVNEHTDCVGFVGASSLERLGVERPLVELTQRFKKIPAPAAKR